MLWWFLVLLPVAIVILAVWAYTASRAISKRQAEAAPHAEETLDGIFDGKPGAEVKFLELGLPKERVLKGAAERGYRFDREYAYSLYFTRA